MFPILIYATSMFHEDEEKGIIPYTSKTAKKYLGKKVGEEIILSNNETKSRVKILEIDFVL